MGGSGMGRHRKGWREEGKGRNVIILNKVKKLIKKINFSIVEFSLGVSAELVLSACSAHGIYL